MRLHSDPVSPSRHVLRAVITCLTLFYPFFWMSQTALGTVPALLQASVAGGELSYLRGGLFGIEAFSSGAGPLGSAASFWITALSITAALALAARRLPRYRPLLGFALTVWGFDLIWRVSRSLFGPRRLSPEEAVLTALAIACAYVGLRSMAPAIGRSARIAQAVSLAGTIAISLLGGVLALRLLAGFPWGGWLARDFPAILLMTALAFGAGWTRRGRAGEPRRSWVGALAGAALTIALFFGSEQVGQAWEEQAEQARRQALAAAPENRRLARVDDDFFFKAVNFTAEWPVFYDSPAAREMLEKLLDYNINAIALVPYGGGRLGSPEFRWPGRWENDEGVKFLASVDHDLGLRVLLKPQTWFRGGYPGDQEFSSQADLERFFENYHRFVEHYARLASEIHADVYCIGVEFAKLTRHEREWRELIALARSLYDGPLTYAANFGEEFETVRFWDALDYIGLDNYYPLSDDLSTQRAEKRIEKVHQRFRRPVLFTEAGFPVYEMAHERPWEDRPGGTYSPEAQARCYQAFFEGYYDEPWLKGIFWWKVGAAGEPRPQRGSHIPWGRPAMDVIAEWYARPPGP